MFFIFKKDHLITFMFLVSLFAIGLFFSFEKTALKKLIFWQKCLYIIGYIFLMLLFGIFSEANKLFDFSTRIKGRSFIPHFSYALSLLFVSLFLPLTPFSILALLFLYGSLLWMSVVNLEINQLASFYNIGLLIGLSTILHWSFSLYICAIFLFLMLETKYTYRYYFSHIFGVLTVLILFYGIDYIFPITQYMINQLFPVVDFTEKQLPFLTIFSVLSIVGLFKTIQVKSKEVGIAKRAQNALFYMAIIASLLTIYYPLHVFVLLLISSFFIAKYLLESTRIVWVEIFCTALTISLLYALW